jgi:hypothetical protein
LGNPEYPMISRMITALLAAAAGLSSVAAVELAPHRAVYDLTLLSTDGRSVTDARGRIVFEIGGSSCAGWTVTFRQVLQMASEGNPSRLTDMSSTSFESNDAKLFRFVIERRNDGVGESKIEGRADRADDKLNVDLKSPQVDRATLPGNISFPVEHTRRLVKAALAGTPVFQIPLFDGSDGGKRVYDTLAVIGKLVDGKDDPRIEEPLRDKPEGSLRRWRTKLSYFKLGEGGDQTPVYVLDFDAYENGVSANLVLDYGYLKLKGVMKSIEFLPPAKC